MVEAGYKQFVFGVDCALLAPAKTPPEAVKWLETETLKVLKTKDIQDKLHKAGFLVRAQGADACWKRVTNEIGLFKGHHRNGAYQEDVSRPPDLNAPAVTQH